MKFNSQICTTREQSERLLALGLKEKTADMIYECNVQYPYDYDLPPRSLYEGERFITGVELADIPAWSLHRLIEMMPKCVMAHSSGDDSPRLHPYVPKFDYLGVTIENTDEFYANTDLFNNICDAIEWLIKGEYFPKEYLV